MPQPRKLYLGPFQPALETALAEEIAAAQQSNRLTPLTVVVPTWVLGLHLSRTLAPHANIRFTTLDDQPAPPRLGLELLCRRLAKACDGYFAPVHDTPGFAGALLETFKDLEQAGLAEFTGQTKKLRELAAAYKTYRQWLNEHGFLQTITQTPKSKLFLYGFYDLTTIQKQLVEQLAPAAVFFPQVAHSVFAAPLLDWFQSQHYEVAASSFILHPFLSSPLPANPPKSAKRSAPYSGTSPTPVRLSTTAPSSAAVAINMMPSSGTLPSLSACRCTSAVADRWRSNRMRNFSDCCSKSFGQTSAARR